jgi:predicted lipoprotein with Yx(FWY)xxD motif
MREMRLLSVAVILAVLGASCGGAEDEPAAEDTAADDTAEGSVVVDTAASDVGTILVDGDGMTLYLFDEDEPGTSTCHDGCAGTWPPLIGEATASADADAGLLGTTERDDGSLQVTYDGMPLYHYAPDQEPGQIEGQGVGGIWWVVSPDGQAITDEAPAASPGGGY